MPSLQEIGAFMALSSAVVIASTVVTVDNPDANHISQRPGWTGGSFYYQESDVEGFQLPDVRVNMTEAEDTDSEGTSVNSDGDDQSSSVIMTERDDAQADTGFNLSKTWTAASKSLGKMLHSHPNTIASIVAECMQKCEDNKDCAGIDYREDAGCSGYSRIPMSLYPSSTGFAAFLKARSTLGWDECSSQNITSDITNFKKLTGYHSQDIYREVETNITVTGLDDGDELIMAKYSAQCPFRFPAGEQQTVFESKVSFKAPKEGTFKICLKEAGKSCIKSTSLSIYVRSTLEIVQKITPDTVVVGTSNKIKLEGGRSQDEACFSMNHCRYACQKDSKKLVLNTDAEIQVPDLQVVGEYHLCYRIRNTQKFVQQENVTLNVTSEETPSPSDNEPTADKGAGDKGAGDKGAGDKGAGDKAAGNKGAGNKGAGNKGASTFPIQDFLLGWFVGSFEFMTIWIVMTVFGGRTSEGEVDSSEQPETSEEVSVDADGNPTTGADENPTATTDDAAAES